MKSAIIHKILYYDLFEYPLTVYEIAEYCCLKDNSIENIRETINSLVSQKLLNHQGEFYFVGSDSKVERRLRGNENARKRLPTARRFAKLISCFPFVRAVWISGSLSKGYLGPKDDIDYFIVTEPGRLWLSRTLLTLFKKVFLLNSYKNFCINYFVDIKNLKIKEQNLYKATETLFMIPMVNKELFREFVEINSWALKYYPNYELKIESEKTKRQIFKRFLEKMLSGNIGNRLENWLFGRSKKVVKKKYANLDAETFNKSFFMTVGELRYFPGAVMDDLMERLELKIKEFCQEHKLSCLEDLDKLQ